MAKPLSMDLRERIVADCDAGISVPDVACKYRVSKRTIFNLLDLRKETGSVAPRQGKVGRKSKLEDRRDEIEAVINENSNLTLQAIISELSLPISESALWKTLNRWGITWKKSDPRRRTAAI